jgi:integrase
VTQLLSLPGHDSSTLAVVPGPWDADIWYMEESRKSAGMARSLEACAVEWCERPAIQHSIIVDGWRTPTGYPICKGHLSRWSREGRPDLAEFVEAQRAAKPFRSDPRRDIYPIDMTRFPPHVRHELRFVISTKVLAGDWTLNDTLRTFLVRLGDVTERLPSSVSFLDHDAAWWQLRLSTSAAERGESNWYMKAGHGRLAAVLKHLELNLTVDPWAADYWTPVRCRVPNARNDSSIHVDWRGLKVGWLKEGSKAYGSDVLRSGARSWGTVCAWARSLRLLDAYLIERRIDCPEAITRREFQAFLRWVVETNDNKTRRNLVNRAAVVLGDLRDEGYIADLPDVAFLRRGENPTRPARDPKPIPPDVVSQIDRILAAAPELTPTMRRMYWLFRRGGPRPSEALDIPIDAIQRTPRGSYKVEYYMTKVEAWRRFPISDQLGEELLEQAAWVRATYGDNATLLFPNERASRPAKGDFPGQCKPYSADALRRRLVALFDRHGLKPSSMTSSKYSGGQLHRFRHTVATELLNADWSQYEVQEFLGHKSPTMMQHYAKINDDRLAEKYKQAIGLVDKDGNPSTLGVEEEADVTVDRLAQKFMKAALCDGFCALPEHIKCSFRPNPCLDCDFYRTGPAFLGLHIRHRTEVETMIERAREHGNDRIIELNQPTLDHLNRLIPRIEEARDGDLVAPR